MKGLKVTSVFYLACICLFCYIFFPIHPVNFVCILHSPFLFYSGFRLHCVSFWGFSGISLGGVFEFIFVLLIIAFVMSSPEVITVSY